MAAPTTAAYVKKTLANPEPSTHGPEPQFAHRSEQPLSGVVRTCQRSPLNVANDPNRKPSVHRSSLLDHLVCGRQQRFRDGEAERLGGLEVDDEIEFGRLQHRQVGRLLAF